jgi:hypothetical protein
MPDEEDETVDEGTELILYIWFEVGNRFFSRVQEWFFVPNFSVVR